MTRCEGNPSRLITRPGMNDADQHEPLGKEFRLCPALARNGFQLGLASQVNLFKGGVCSAARFEDMKEKTNKILYAYWNGVRGNRVAPKRFEIEPSSIAAILPDTFILERGDAGTMRFRLAGTRLCEAFGTEFRGANFADFFGPEDRATLNRQFAVIARQGAGGLFGLEAETASAKIAHFEILILPLIHTRDIVDRFLGAMSPDKAYPWLGIEPISKQRLVSAELIWPDGRPHAMIDNSSRQSPFMPHVRNARIVRSDRRHFRVYDGGLAKTDDDA